MRKESAVECSRWESSMDAWIGEATHFWTIRAMKIFIEHETFSFWFWKKCFYFELWICECILKSCIIDEVKLKKHLRLQSAIINQFHFKVLFISRKWFQGSFQSNSFGNWINPFQCTPMDDVIWKQWLAWYCILAACF